MPEFTQKNIREAIDALQILAEMGDEQAQQAIDALEVLLTDANVTVSLPASNLKSLWVVGKGFVRLIAQGSPKALKTYFTKNKNKSPLKDWIAAGYGVESWPIDATQDEVESYAMRSSKRQSTDQEYASGGMMAKGGKISGEFRDARYAKGKIAYHPPKSTDWSKNREMRLAEAKGVNGKWSHREKAYIMSIGQAERLKKYLLEGKNANSISGEIYEKGGITGGYEDLTDMYLSQKIEMLLSKVRPYENYYIDEESNKLYIYFTTEITTDEAEYVMKLLTSSPEFFDADTAATDYDGDTDRTVISVKLNREVEYGKGGMLNKAGRKRSKFRWFGEIIKPLTKNEQELVDVNLKTSLSNLLSIMKNNTIVDEISSIKYALEDLIAAKKDTSLYPGIQYNLDEFHEKVANYLREEGKLHRESDDYGKGGTTFQDKVNAISGRLEGTEVPRRLRSDYGRRYNKEEAKKAAQRIAGAMRKKGY